MPLLHEIDCWWAMDLISKTVDKKLSCARHSFHIMQMFSIFCCSKIIAMLAVFCFAAVYKKHSPYYISSVCCSDQFSKWWQWKHVSIYCVMLLVKSSSSSVVSFKKLHFVFQITILFGKEFRIFFARHAFSFNNEWSVFVWVCSTLIFPFPFPF